VRTIRTVATIATATLLTLAAASPTAATVRHGPGLALGSPVRVEPLPAALRLAGAGPAWRLAYVSTSWSGRPRRRHRGRPNRTGPVLVVSRRCSSPSVCRCRWR
jgi:hypothetical protein